MTNDLMASEQESSIYSSDLEEENSSIYSSDIEPSSSNDTYKTNTTMSYMKSLNEDASLVNFYQNLSNSANVPFRQEAKTQAQQVRVEQEEAERQFLRTQASLNLTDEVQASAERLNALISDKNSMEVPTYQDVKDTAQKASETVLAIQQIAEQTGKTPEEIVSQSKTLSKAFSVRATLENMVSSLEERSFPVQLAQDVLLFQTGEDLLSLIPAVNKTLEKYGKEPANRVDAVSSVSNVVLEGLDSLDEASANLFLYDLKDSLVDAVGEKDARRFLEYVSSGQKSSTDVGVDRLFVGLDALAIGSVIKASVRGTVKLANPGRLAIQTGAKDAVAQDVVRLIANQGDGALGLTREEAVKLTTSLVDEDIIPKHLNTVSREVQDNIKSAVDTLKQEIQAAMPTAGVNKQDVLQTAERLERAYSPNINKNIRNSTVTPELNTMNVYLETTYDNFGTLFKSKDEALAAYKGKVLGQLEAVEVTEDAAKVIKGLQQEAKVLKSKLDAAGFSVKATDVEIPKVKNLDAVPPSKQARVESLHEALQYTNLASKEIAKTIKNVAAKDAKLAQELQSQWVYIRKEVNQLGLKTDDARAISRVLNTGFDKDVFSFKDSLEKANELVRGVENVTPEVQKLSKQYSDVVEKIIEAKAGTFVSKGYVVKQKYLHPVFTDDSLSAYSVEDLEKTHGAILGTMNPALRSVSELYNNSLLTVFKNAKLGQGFVKFFDAFPKLKAVDLKKLNKAIVDGDALEKEFSPVELASQFGMDTDNTIQAYYQYRTARNVLHSLKDAQYVRNLNAQGLKEVNIRIFDAEVNDYVNTSFKAKPVKDIDALEGKRVYDFNTGKGTIYTKEKLGSSGNGFFEVSGKYQNGKTAYNYVMIEPNAAKVHDITSVIGKRVGTFSRVYQDSFWIKTKRRFVTDDAPQGEDVFAAFRTSASLKDAEKYVAGLRSLKELAKGATVKPDDVKRLLGDLEGKPQKIADDFNDGVYNDVEFVDPALHNSEDNFFRSAVFAGGRDPMNGQLFFSGRGDNAIPSITKQSMEANVADPWESIQREIGNTANFLSMSEFRQNAVQKWYNTFKDDLPADVLGRDADDTFFKAMNNLGGLKGLDTPRQKQLISQLKSTMLAIGVEHPVERFGRTLSLRAANIAEKGFDALHLNNVPVLKHTPGALRNTDLTNMARYVTSHAFLGMLSPRSLFVQAMGFMQVSALHPIHGLKASASIKPLLQAYHSNSPDVIAWASRLESVKTTGLTTKEFERISGAMKRIGLLDNIGASTISEGADVTRGAALSKAKQGFDATSFYLFNKGEAINRVGAFEVARRVFIQNNPGAVWDTTEALTTILAHADTMSANMTKASTAVYQRGLVAIPAQFLQFSIKSTANYLAGLKNIANKGVAGSTKGLSRKEVLAGSVFGLAFYGLDNVGISNVLSEYLGPELNSTLSAEQKTYLTQGVWAGIINSVAERTTGVEAKLAIGKMASPYNAWSDLANVIYDGQFELNSATGAFGSLLEKGAGIPIIYNTLYNREDISAGDIGKALIDVMTDVSSGLGRLEKAYLISQRDGLVFDNKQQLQGQMSSFETLAYAAGFNTTLEVTQNKVFRSEREYQAAMKNIAKTIQKYKKAAFDMDDVKDFEGAAAAQKHIDSIMNTVPVGDRAAIEKYVKEDPSYRAAYEKAFTKHISTSAKWALDPNNDYSKTITKVEE